jgi:putative transposase
MQALLYVIRLAALAKGCAQNFDRNALERTEHRRRRRRASPRCAAPRRSSTVKAPKRLKGGSTLDQQGFDAAKKVTGRKRHILVDTLGLLLNVVFH